MPHPQGTCVLFKWADKKYIKNPNVLFELKGVHINEKQCDMIDISDQ